MRNGVLRDGGNISYLRIVTVKEIPRILDLRGADILKAQHACGTNDIIAEMEQLDGGTIFDPHVITIEDGGMKDIDRSQIDFKKQADPHGLMNPGKTRGWTKAMARP